MADVFDACRSARPYRDQMPLDRVMQIIRDGSGTQLDPLVIAALESVVAEDGTFMTRLRAA